MSIEDKTPDVSPPALPLSQLSKPQRVLACVLCQQRKVKCDRRYPCANCTKSRVQCIPATQVSRRRRRRFPERELLERLRKYEDLLRQNNIKFEPLHKDAAVDKESPNAEGSYDSDDEQPKTAKIPSTTFESERVYEAKDIWHAMSQEFREANNNSDSSDDDVRGLDIRKAFDQFFEHNDHLLFGSRQTAVDISTLHPEPVQIFRLWQLYLENVDPLLKVTHTPSLQGSIIEAASNVLNIRPTLEALMFSIYCMSISSLGVDECQAMFGSSKVDLLTRYQFGCQQALSNCGFLRSSDRDCLTALHLYLVSVRPSTSPQSLSSMLGVAIRIAQRMGIHSEAALAKCTALEAELRRRLWWSLVLFDARVGEITNFKPVSLTPTWDCRILLNVNDSDFRLEMKDPPQVQGQSTEALFAVVRSELGNHVRRTMFHLEFTNPALKPDTKDIQYGPIPEKSDLVGLEKLIEDKYLKHCNPENPLHFMTIWNTRLHLAKYRLMEHFSSFSTSSTYQTEAQRDAAFQYALRMLECDTKILNSPHTKGYLWLAHFHFPLPAYVQIVQSLKRRRISAQADRVWGIINDSYEARFDSLRRDDIPFFGIFAKIVLQAWDACKETAKESGESLVTPRFVLSVRQRMTQIAQNASAARSNGATNVSINDFPALLPTSYDGHGLFYGMGAQDGYMLPELGPYAEMPGLTPLDIDPYQLDWSAMDWDLVNIPAGEPRGL